MFFFTNFVRSKIASFLRPWLDEEPEFELKLGFLKSVATVKNLSFNSSAFNPLIEKSTRLAFERVKIGEVRIRISPWSFPSLILDVRGVDVTLTAREPVVDQRASRDFAMRKRKAVIASLDPEGVSLHEIVERILVRGSSVNRHTTLANVMLRCCQIQFTGIYIQLQLINESHACMLRVDGFSFEHQFFNQSSLFRGLVGFLLVPGEETVLSIGCSCMEFGVMEKDHSIWITSLMGVCACVRLNDLQPSDCGIWIPHVYGKISPMDIPVLLVLLDVLSVKENFKGDRTGQELWKIAAERICPQAKISKHSFHNLVNIVLLWSHYIHAYESLLAMIGYYAGSMSKENSVMVFRDRKHLSLVTRQYKSVKELEEKLPAEAVACARQVARHRELSHSILPVLESNTDFTTNLPPRISSLLLLMLKVIRFICVSVVQLCFMGKISGARHGINALSMLGGVSSDLASEDSELHFCLNVGEVEITLSQVNDDHAIIGEQVGSEVNLRRLKFMPFHFIIRCFYLEYTAYVITTAFFVALGELKLCLSSLPSDNLMTSNVRSERNPSFKGLNIEKGDESNIILWSDPASLHYPSEDDAAIPSNAVESALAFILQNSIKDLRSNWKKIGKKYDEMNVKHKEQPFILCELKNTLMEPYARRGRNSLCKCSFVLGKLNFDLEYSSILSTTMLIKQVHHYHQLASTVGRAHSHSHSTVTIENSQISWEDGDELFTHRIKEILSNTIPDKNLQIGVLLAGPSIRISSQHKLLGPTEEDFDPLIARGSNHYFFTFDMENIEFAVWPASKNDLAQITGESSFSDAPLEYLWQKECRRVDIPSSHLNEKFFCRGRIALGTCVRFNGLTVIVDDVEVTQQSRILEPWSITLHCAICRDYLYSLAATVNILSLAMSAFAAGATVFLYVDELWIFLQLFEGISSVVLSTCNHFEYASLGDSEDLVRTLTAPARTNTERNTAESAFIAKTMIINNTQIVIDAIFELEAMDVILSDSRGKFSSGTFMNSDGASSSATTYLSISPTGRKYKIREMLDLPGFGVGLFVKRSCSQISGEGNHLDILVDISGIRSVIFSCQSVLELEVKKLLEKSPECLHRIIVSNCNFSIHIGSVGAILSSADVGNVIDGSDLSNHSGSLTHTEGSMPQIRCPEHVLEVCYLLTTVIPEATSGCWLLVRIQLGKIHLAENCVASFAEARQANKLEILIHICKELHTVNCNIQGGDVFLESSTLAMFAHCLEAYFLLISKHPLLLPNDSTEELTKNQSTTAKPNSIPSGVFVFGSVLPGFLPQTEIPFNWVFFQDFAVDISQFSVILAGKNGSGGIQELILEVDMRLKCLTSERKIIFDLDRFSIFTQQLHRCMPYKSKDLLIPHFRPSTFVTLPSQIRSGNHTSPSQCADSVSATLHDQSTNSAAFPRENLVENGASDSAHHVSYILKHLTASLRIEKMISEREVNFVPSKSDWVGNGCVSGVDFTLTSYEIQMVSSLLLPLSGIFGGKRSQYVKQSVSSRSQEWDTTPDHTIPDGAIVALKDLHEHMYFAIEAVDSKYRVVGVIHYTLVSERALFRVKYHKGWRSQVSRISLISLFAKNNHGEPLRLNFSPGSGFVEISSSDDKSQALWEIFPSKSKSFEEEDDIKYYKTSSGKAFHLVNQKNKCAIAFVDGLPEFVKKPGNLLKAKVLNEFSLTNGRRINVSYGCTDVTPDVKSQEGQSPVDREVSGFGSKHPHVNITIDKATLTIFHEISDVSGKVPILCGSINEISIIGQIISSKMRMISSFNISIQYMDARRNLWRDIVSPVASSLFFHSRFTFPDTNNVYQGAPAHLFFNMKQVDLSLTEISVDILLYLVGKLNIAGPYAVRMSSIFPYCCKLENHSGLSLLCQFSDNQVVKLAGKQSDSVFLRHVATSDHFDERESSISVSPCKEGIFSTSPINILLSTACFFAWRTRAISLQADSRGFPGPFMVMEVSKKTEEGLCLCVSPLLRISNESGFSMELCFRRPQETEECATILLRDGDTVDDAMAAFDAFELSGGSKRALMSLALGNFLLSVKPEIDENIKSNGKSVSAEFSEDLQGSKALCMTGIFDKLNYRFRKVLGVELGKSFFSSLCCPLIVEGQRFAELHFLVQTTGRDVPVMQPPVIGGTSEVGTSPVALLVQKEIFIYPTVQVHNLLQSEILLHVAENHPDISLSMCGNHIGKQATIPCESSAFLYANPAIMYFTVTLTAHRSRCKPVSSADWIKKLHKQKTEAHYIDTELDFDGGKYFASLRLSIGDKGFLEVTVFSSYTFQNNTDFPLLFYASNQKPPTWEEIQKYSFNLPPELGCLLAQKSMGSWFLKSKKVHLKRLEEKESASLLDLDVLSGFTEICLEAKDDIGFSRMTKLGLSLQPCPRRAHVPSQVVRVVPRYIIANESKETVFVRQCYLQMDDFGEIIPLEGKQKITLQIRTKAMKRKDRSILDSVLKRHRSPGENSLVFIQFCLNEDGFSWSGPVCVASLGRFFLKFKRSAATLNHSNSRSLKERKSQQFALVHIVEECSSLVLHFYFPAKIALPYRIENCLRGSSVTYFQKDSVESDTLEPGDSVEYAWDHLNLPHRLVVQVTEMHLLREINIDKICSWKPLFKLRQHNGMVIQLPLGRGFPAGRGIEESHRLEMFKVGYEVFADGPTRVLRICEGVDSHKEEKVQQPCIAFQFRVPNFAMHLIEKSKQDVDSSGLPICSTIIVARLSKFALGSLITDRFKYYSMAVQSLNVDEKWQGAPFASMIRRSQIHDSGSTEDILHIVFVVKLTNSNVKEVKYSSIILQPIDLKVDEETLMRLVPFWRTSLSTSRTQSQQFYFKHFEIHPIKITASFLPGNPYSSYSSAQETLRSLLHSTIKIPAVNNKVVELNGILLTHAFVTFRELVLKCAQHYSWYIFRAIYIAKGSLLLPPAFASIFDDTASSSLDVFFDPSDGSISLPGLTLGMFKFISKCIDSKGFSGTKRYFGDLGKTIKIAGSNALFAAVTEISDNILKGAETGGFNGMVHGFYHGILRLAMEPSLLGAAVLEGGPDRKIKLDRSPGVDELYIEGYLQAMLDVMYRQEYLRVRVIDNQVVLKNLPPSSFVINEIVENVKSFLVSKALLKGDAVMASRPLRHLQTESEWRIGPTVLTLCEHLFVSFTIRMLRKQANKFTFGIRWKLNSRSEGEAAADDKQQKASRKWAVGKFVFSGVIAYLDGRLCRHIPNPIARRIVSGFLLSYLDDKEVQ